MIYVVTGAAGHLGGTIVRQLAARGETVRGLVLPGEQGLPWPNVAYIRGDVRDAATLWPLFEGLDASQVVCIHCAGIISIQEELTEAMVAVNVDGTENILRVCREAGIRKLVYVSSVHAIPEGSRWRVITEADTFSPDWVRGGYAKSKAMATQRVLDAASQGQDVTIVHPSGILGPYDRASNHLVQFVDACIHGKLPAGVRGGYDCVDVRDVADGCLRAAEAGRPGACYILSNRHYDVADLMAMIRDIKGGRHVPVVPMWLARMLAPLFGAIARLRHQRPLYTRYSLYTLASNDRFSHDKATRELGYSPRDLYDTLRDTIRWLQENEEEAASKEKKIEMQAV